MLSVVRCYSWWHFPLVVTQAYLWKDLGLLSLESQDWYKSFANHHTYNQSTKKWYQPKHERLKSFNLCLFHTGPDHQDLLISGFWRELHSCSNALTQEYFETLSDEMISWYVSSSAQIFLMFLNQCHSQRIMLLGKANLAYSTIPFSLSGNKLGSFKSEEIFRFRVGLKGDWEYNVREECHHNG